MFRSRMIQILFRGSAPATAPKPSLGAQRIPSVASPQITTRSARFSNSSRSWTTQSRSPFRTFRSQPFSTFGRRSFNNGGQNYKRFNNAPPLIQLLSRLQPHHYVMIGLGGGLFYVYNIETVEMSGRKRFNCISASRELKVGKKEYQELMAELQGRILPENHPLSINVTRVLERLIPAAPIENAEWKVHVINDPNQANAFVLPGGKVFVFTGMLPICQDEDGLAAVLGHEIAHVVAHHPAERMSNNGISLVLAFVTSFLFDISGQLSSLLLSLAYGLPNSRSQESEADEIGLMIMSKACFNPEAAVKLWDRMNQRAESQPPQFLSTHPSNSDRMENLRTSMYKAESIYEDSGCHVLGSFVPDFERASSNYRW